MGTSFIGTSSGQRISQARTLAATSSRIFWSSLLLASSTLVSNALAITGVDLYTLPPTNGATNVGKHGATGGLVVSGSKLHSIAQPGGIDLTVPGFASTFLFGTDGIQQAGSTNDEIGGVDKARLWTGSPGTSVSLHNANYESTTAGNVAGGKQIGSGRALDGNSHALLWSGTAASLIDLHPAGYFVSYGADTDGVQQVGEGLFAVPPPEPAYHALLWTGQRQV